MKYKVFFFIWPFLSFVNAIGSGFSKKSHKLIITLFCGFVGLNISVDSESSDINRYKDRFQYFYDKDYSFFFEYLTSYVQFEAKHYDVFTQIIYFILSRFTDNPYLLYLVFGLIFGFFYSEIFSQIGKHVKKKLKLFDYILIVSLLLIIFPTKGINQFRFYTASVIFISGILSYVNKEKKTAFFFMILSIVTHIALLLPILSFVFSLFFKNISLKIFITALLVVIVGGISLTSFEQYINLIGGAVDSKYGEYTGEIAEDRMENFKSRVWYASYYRELLVISLLLPFIYIMRKIKVLHGIDKRLILSISFLTLFTALTFNLYMYHRYFDLLAFLLLLFIIIVKFKYCDKKFNFYLIIISPVIILAAALNFSDVLRFLNPFILIDNYFTVWFFQGVSSIKSFL
jgi:hypothetical protein